MKIDCAHDELVDVAILQPNPKNYNKHPARQIEMLAKIINYQGQRSPIVVSKRSGFIVKGHGRLDAIKLLGWDKAAVDYQEYTDEAQEYADMIADNKIAELSETDAVILNEVGVLLGDSFDPELLGLEESLGESYIDNDDGAEPDKPQSFKVEVLCVNGEEMTALANELTGRGMIAKAIFNG
jgi:ParB-like chromosome segregation protein Spo0J